MSAITAINWEILLEIVDNGESPEIWRGPYGREPIRDSRQQTAVGEGGMIVGARVQLDLTAATSTESIIGSRIYHPNTPRN